MHDFTSRALALCLALLPLAAIGCAESHRDDSLGAAASTAEPAGVGVTVQPRDGSTARTDAAAATDSGGAALDRDAGQTSSPAGSGAATPSTPPRDAGAAADSGGGDSDDAGNAITAQPGDCRGPGAYWTGQGFRHVDCCEGFHEFQIPLGPGYQVDETPICVPGNPAYACIRGECGDGLCELGEDRTCGCTADCPSAVWERPPVEWPNGLSGPLASCSTEDLLARLKVDGDGMDCGDLPVDVTLEDRQKATKCARDAYAMNLPFQVFWRLRDGDMGQQINRVGVYATRRADGTLVSYALFVDVPYNVNGVMAQWHQCTMPSDEKCAADFDRCLDCELVDQATPICACFPEGPRPDAPDRPMLEVQCKPVGT